MAKAKAKSKTKGSKAPKSKQEILKRVRALIARTASSEEEEARTSAFLACKLIREHGLVVGLKTPKKPAATSQNQYPNATSQGTVNREWWEDPFDSFFDGMRVDPFGSDVYITTARRPARCSHCDSNISPGQRVAFHRRKRKSYHHPQCADEAFRRGARPT